MKDYTVNLYEYKWRGRLLEIVCRFPLHAVILIDKLATWTMLMEESPGMVLHVPQRSKDMGMNVLQMSQWHLSTQRDEDNRAVVVVTHRGATEVLSNQLMRFVQDWLADDAEVMDHRAPTDKEIQEAIEALDNDAWDVEGEPDVKRHGWRTLHTPGATCWQDQLRLLHEHLQGEGMSITDLADIMYGDGWVQFSF